MNAWVDTSDRAIVDAADSVIECDVCPCNTYVESGCYMNPLGPLVGLTSAGSPGNTMRTVGARSLAQGSTHVNSTYNELLNGPTIGDFTNVLRSLELNSNGICSFKHNVYSGLTRVVNLGTQCSLWATLTRVSGEYELLLELYPENGTNSVPAYSWLKCRTSGASTSIDYASLVTNSTLYYHSQGGAGGWWVTDGTLGFAGSFLTPRALDTRDTLFYLQGLCQSKLADEFSSEPCSSLPRIMFGTIESSDTELDGQVVEARHLPGGAFSNPGFYLGFTPNNTRNRGMGLLVRRKETTPGSGVYDIFSVSFSSVTSVGQAGIQTGLPNVPIGGFSTFCNNVAAWGPTVDFTSGDRKNDIGIASMSCVTGAFAAVTNWSTLSGSGATIRVHLSE